MKYINMRKVNKIVKYLLIFIFSFTVIMAIAESQNRTVKDLINKVSKQKVKKKRTVLPETVSRSKSKKIQRSQLRAVAPTKRTNLLFRAKNQDEAELGRLLDAEIKQLFTLMRRYQRSKNRGEIWLRLAERYMEKSKLVEFTLQEKFDERLKKWEAAQKKGAAPKLNLKSAQGFKRKAISLYKLFLENFPKDNKVDQALFFLGYNHYDLNQLTEGVKYYNQLLKEHPRSPYIEEVYFSLGEYHFEKTEWVEAKKKFLKVLRRKKKGKFYNISSYKMAWCEFNLGDGAKAMRYLERVLKRTRRMMAQGQQKGRSRLEFNPVYLAGEAARDLVVFYSKIKNYKRARSYFRGLFKPEDANKHLEQLAYIYADSKSQEATRHLFKRLIADNPNSKKAFEYQKEIVEVYYGFKSSVFKSELFDWVVRYSKKSQWAMSNSQNKDVLQEAEDVRESALREYILNIHKTAQKSNSVRNKGDAVSGYKVYLKYFPDHKEAIEMRFYFAELLYDMKMFEQASKNYLRVANIRPKNKYTNEAVINAILALDQKLQKSEGRLSKDTNKIPYRKAEKQFLVITQKYLPLIKQSHPDRIANIEFKRAYIMYAHNQFESALKAFWDIIKAHPRSEFVESSAHLILDIHNLKKDYQGLIASGTRLVRSEELSPKLRAEIKEIVERSQFQIAQDLEKRKEYQKSAEAYSGFADKNRNSKLFSVAVFNAAINFERASNILKAIQYHRHVLNQKDAFSKKNHHQKSRRILATLYEKTGQLEKAAIHFERYAKNYPNDQYTAESYYNAAIIFRGLRRTRRAIQSFNSYYDVAQKSKKVERAKYLAALISIAEIHEKARQGKLAYAYYERYVKENSPDASTLILAHIHLARIAKALRWNKRADDWYKKVVAIQKVYPNVGKSEAAEAKFHLLQETYRQFISMKIPASESQQARVINQKLALLKDLNKKLAEVIIYDDPDYVVRSVTLIGEANEHFAKAVMTVPLPKGLTKEQQKEYKDAVEQKLAALPRRTAIENYKLAIQRSSDLKTYNDAVKKAFERLGVMQPDTYFRMKEVPIKVVKLDLFQLKLTEDNKKYALFITAIQNEEESDVVREGAKILAKDSGDGVVLNGLAVFYLQTKRPDLAKIYLGKALKTKLPKTVLQNNRAVALLMEGGSIKPAVDDLFDTLKESGMSGPAAANLGYILLDHQDIVNAVRFLEIAAEAFPEDPIVLNNYAIALRYTEEFNRAKTFYERALSKDASDMNIQLNYARLLVDKFKEGEKEKAAEILNKLKFIGSDSKVIDEADLLLDEVRQ